MAGLESAATIRTKVFVWGLNDKDQLGGLKGSKVLSLLKKCLCKTKISEVHKPDAEFKVFKVHYHTPPGLDIMTFQG